MPRTRTLLAALLALAACSDGWIGDTFSLRGDVRIVCWPGTLQDPYCVADEAAEGEVAQTLTCEGYANSGWQVLTSIENERECGGECCTCEFDIDPECRPGAVND